MKNVLSMKNILMLVLGMLASSFLFAHNSLTESVPADQAQLHQSPEFIELSFSDETYLNSMVLSDAEGKEVPLELNLSGELASHFKVKLPILEAGNYQVNWQVEGLDTHKINGNFSFIILEAR